MEKTLKRIACILFICWWRGHETSMKIMEFVAGHPQKHYMFEVHECWYCGKVVNVWAIKPRRPMRLKVQVMHEN